MSDLINRQDAIDAVEFGVTYAKILDVTTGEARPLFEEGNDALKKAVERLKELPTVEPKKVYIANITLSEEQIREAVEKANSEIIQVLPSTQPEIIRCKDCKYASPNGKYGCKAYHFKLYETHAMFADDYCSRAERKEVAREHDKL